MGDCRGLIALTAVPGRRLLAGLEHPSSNIVLFDPGTDRVQARAQAIVPGIPWREGNPLSREIVATRQGRIYTYRGSEEPRHRARRHAVWVHDLGTGGEPADDRHGHRRLLERAERNARRRRDLPVDRERRAVPARYGERAARPPWPLPAQGRGRRRRAHRPATGIVTPVGRLEAGLYAGIHLRDSRRNLYFGRFGSDRAWQGNAGLAILSP